MRGTGSLLLGGYTALLALFLSVAVTAEDVDLVVLLPPDGAEAGGYFPLAGALESATRLAAEHVNKEGSLLNGTITLSVQAAEEATVAVAGLCAAIDSSDRSTSGGNGNSVAVVSALGTYSTALVGSLSDEYLHLPILNVGSTAAGSESRDDAGSEGGYLLHVRPAILPQMQALVRLILDMKLARDALDGRSETTEQVWILHTSNIYGTSATAAFNAAAKTISVALPDASSDSSATDDGSEETARATVEITGTLVLAASSEATFDAEMATLIAEEASIVVLLAEAFDGAMVRTVLSQAHTAGLTDGVQWFLPDVAAFDSIFEQNSTYRDTQLAFDMRGTLGVRPCMPRTGDGSGRAEALSLEWVRLNADDYPGAGPDGLTADGEIDPLLAFAYDAVFVAASAAQVAQEAINMADDRDLAGIALDRCPFPANGSWADGLVMRDSVLSASTALVGATGPLGMSIGEDDDGRDVGTVTFCAVNLRPHATQGARFEIISTLDGGTLESEDGEGFQAISQFQEPQTFPQGALTYPFDRPFLRGRHLDVVMRRDAPPFVFVEGDGASLDDFTGITPEFLQKLAEVVGFTYSLRAPPSGTSTPTTIEMVRNGSADMTGSWITITAERSEYVAFTYPYYDLGLAFVYKPVVDEGLDLMKAFAPFEGELWLMLFASLLVTVILLWLFEGAKNEQFSKRELGKRRRTVTRGLSRSVYVTSSLMMSQLTHKPETLEGYMLTLGWLFSSFVLAASYTAELASFLTATKLATTSLTIEKLKSGEISHSSVALLQGGNTQLLYERDFQGCTGIEECSLGVQPLACFSAVECFSMVLNGTALTTMVDSATAEYELQNEFCGLTTLSEFLYPQHYGLVLPYGSGLTDELQAATLHLREDGTLSDIVDAYLDPSAICVPATTSDEDSSNMTISDVSGVFVVLGLFIVAAVSSWSCRRSPWAKSAKERRRRKKDDLERSVLENAVKITHGQRKPVGSLQDTISLLQESQALARSSSTGVDESVFRRQMAEGRPVVSLGDSGRGRRRPPSFRAFLSKLPGLGSESRSRQHSLSQQQQQQQQGSSVRDREERGGDGGGDIGLAVHGIPVTSIVGGGGDDGISRPWPTSEPSSPPLRTRTAGYTSPHPPPNEGDLATRSAASKWPANRGGEGGEEPSAVASDNAEGGGSTVVAATSGVDDTRGLTRTLAGEATGADGRSTGRCYRVRIDAALANPVAGAAATAAAAAGTATTTATAAEGWEATVSPTPHATRRGSE